MKIAVLMASHNRRHSTVECLRLLSLQSNARLCEVFLLDDGSTDGTADAVAKEFPNVRIIQGEGNLYWAKGMRLAWETATKSADYDFYLWLNDDLNLKRDALSGVLADYYNTGSVIVGACSEDEVEAVCSYGASNASDNKIIPNGAPQRAEGWLNGNCVLVPRDVYKRIGMISSEYTHARADYDYAERLKNANIPFYCSSKYVGVCHNDFHEKVKELALWQRLQMLWRPGYFNLHDLWLIRLRYHGITAAILSCTHLTYMVIRGIK